MKNYENEYMNWIQYEELDKELMAELELIKDQTEEIEERFYKDLEFGTGGLRGVIGAGTNRMNIYTIRKLTLALANYIISKGEEAKERGVVIAYDSRRYSKEFAQETAKVLALRNINVYIFNELRPLPILSFAVRYLHTFSGVVITASHNPPEYNGYKVYNENGSQLTEPDVKEIYNEIKKIKNILEIPVIDFKQAIADKKIKIIDEQIDYEYIKHVKNLLINKEYIDKYGENLRVVYTPLHGTGNKIVKKVMQEINFKNIYIVKEQEEPNPDFPTVKAPNPEEPEVFDLAIKLAEKVGADIIMATDPDADRLGLLIKKDDTYQALSGNQIGALIIYYLLNEKSKRKMLLRNSIIIKTIVTSDLGKEIANKFNIVTENTLTGFKYIGEKINKYESDINKSFLFGYEESFGFLVGDFVRDKDAVQLTALIIEMAIYNKQKGFTLYDILEKIFNEFGYYAEDLLSFKLCGINGDKKINQLLTVLRENPPEQINSIKIKYIEDYLVSKRIDKRNNSTSLLSLPTSNVIKFILEDDSWIALRPSGTEPKVKIYFSAKDDSYEKVLNKLNGLKETVIDIVNLCE